MGGLFLGFFMGCIFSAPVAIFFELDFALHTLPILPGPIVNALTTTAR